MTHRRALAATASAAILLAAAAPGVSAQSVDELEARVAQLEAMLSELRGEMEAARAEASAQTAPAAAPAPAPAPAQTSAAPERMAAAAEPAPVNGFRMGATTIGFGGYVDLDVHATSLSGGTLASNSIGRDFYIPGLTPVGGEGTSDPTLDATAQSSRFFFTAETPTEAGTLTGRIEFDFLGSPGGDERITNSYNPRMRVAWGEIGGFRFGQDWSTFQNLAVIPESASFLTASDGMIFMRQALVRYTAGDFQFALENPETTITPFGGGARIDSDAGWAPDAVARWNRSGDWGSVMIAGMLRNLTFDDGVTSADALGWALTGSGSLNIADGTRLQFSLSGGDGIGRYIGLNAVNEAVLTADGSLEPIFAWGGLLALQQRVAENHRVNVGVSYLAADNDPVLQGLTDTKQVGSVFGAWIVDLTPNVSLGAEIMHGEREIESGESGSITRATVSTRYTF
ncbi:hypothetical protein FKB34_05035 [Glycocaulis profundi]|nr:hypothetical protein FKB34_05035 [Glycocaulis profundi]